MTIRELNGKSICILGFGREGQATLTALQYFAPKATIAIADQNDVATKRDIQIISGADYQKKLHGFDIIIKSPGVMLEPSQLPSEKVTSATELFLSSLPTGTVTIGITGTKGKSSTSNMIYQVLKAAGKKAVLGGNIGVSMLSFLETATAGTIYVLELSSFQLEFIRVSPRIAVLTSFFADHIDHHGDLESYWAAKSNITKYQTKHDAVFYNADYPACKKIAELSPGKHIPFSPQDHGPLEGNRQAVLAVAGYLGIESSVATQTLKAAPGLPHRQELLGTFHDISWIDDSAASTPESAIAAIQDLGHKVSTLIAGGLNRDYNFTRMGAAIAASRIQHVVLFPETGRLIKASTLAAKPDRNISFLETSSMTEAVEWASRNTPKGSTCLLSSGSPSYNLFMNYDERGDAFKAAVAALNH